jgi:transposase
MAITKNGILSYEIHKSNIKKDIFESFILNKVLPFSKNKYILMDNVAFHKTNSLIEKNKLNNTKSLFIPPYSPEFNPIENVFSSIKATFRSVNIFPKNEQHVINSIESYKNYNFSKIYKHIKKIQH